MRDHIPHLRQIEDEDILLLNRWLHKSYILNWYEDPQAWLDEIRQRNGVYNFIHHFIVMKGSQPIGFCQYYDCYEAGEDWYSVHRANETYSIDYLIGEEACLRQGYGRQIICLLIDRIRGDTQGKEIIVNPEEENLASCKALVACGFEYDQTAACYRRKL
ncbi:GCN5-related N-acetyltransferase [Desulfitobacterium hafniense DCB-2]|uniref:GCN5-related N-acetyltransferase n=1 Tax=Desulfitobacterium hafniense (strain DSM 10664 / DCB-2) TaxID=272564 RepID=B8FRE2_DESHD|nr:GNAT family N-acetyltransferase [Desulfitobacterium hafniense]ACL20057.1 GCN5-related N-acetyltransferase [Desulfitobacterium hafniense DCB-2]